MALIDKASLLFVPSVVAQEKAFNILPSGNRAPDSTDQNSGYDQTRADFSFDRGSNAAATRIGSDGLIEKYRENKLVQSNNFGTTWTKQNVSVTSGQSGYDGSSNAWKLIAAGGNNDKILQSVTQTGVVTLSVYAKAGNVNFIAFEYSGYAYFNLSTGAVGISGGIIDSNIEDVGGEWYRCSITVNISSTTNAQIYVAEANNSTNTSNGDFVYIQNAQLETSMVATDYLDSGATTAKAGVLVDLPRINYDANGENGALLLEPSRQNKIQYSEYFGDSSWSQYVFGGASLTKTFGYTSPEGVDNAYKFDVVIGTGGVLLTQNFTATASVDHTLSVWMKGEVGGEKVQIDFKNTSSSGPSGQLFTLTSEWKRYEVTKTNDSGTSRGFQFRMQQSSGISNQTLYVYGAQAEASASYATSYIPNHGASSGVTRAADVCNGAGDASTFNSTEGVLYAEFNTLSINPASSRYITISNGSASNRIAIRQPSGADNQVSLFVVVGGSVQVNLTHTLNILNFNKIAIKYKVNDFALWVNGVEVLTDTSGSVPAEGTLNKLDFANFNGSSLPFEGNAKQILYFPTALTDSELATLTTL